MKENQQSSQTILMGNFSFELTRKRVKNVNLRLSKDGQVKVSAPNRVPLNAIKAFVGDHAEWISSRKNELKLRQEKRPLPKPVIRTGDKINIWDQIVTVAFVSGPKLGVSKLDNMLIVSKPIHEADDAKIRAKINEWLRSQIKSEIPELLNKWSAVTGRPARHWGVKKMKTKWGSCNIQAERIWLNLDLIHYPKSCLEYVIVHELTHLYERYHNKRFYQLLDQFMPEWKTYERALNNSSMNQGLL